MIKLSWLTIKKHLTNFVSYEQKYFVAKEVQC